MKVNDLLKGYVNRREHHPRKVGRYWATDLYGILTDRTKPEDFFKPKKMDLKSSRHIIRGEEKERTLKEIFDANKVKYIYQQKEVVKIRKGIELVVVADFVFDNMIMELKSPQRMSDSIKNYHYPQLEAQYQTFKKPIYMTYINAWDNIKIYRYSPSEVVWNNIVEKLEKFHKEVKKYEKDRGSSRC